ncbi:RAP domain-containing protein [Pycnococcus provasolii]
MPRHRHHPHGHAVSVKSTWSPALALRRRIRRIDRGGVRVRSSDRSRSGGGLPAGFSITSCGFQAGLGSLPRRDYGYCASSRTSLVAFAAAGDDKSNKRYDDDAKQSRRKSSQRTWNKDSPAKLLNARIVKARNDGEVADIVKQHVGEFNEIHVSAAVSRIAKLTARRGTRTLGKSQRDSVLLLLEERLHDFERIRARNVAGLLWSYAKLRYPGNHSAVQCVSDHVLRVVDDFNAMDIANTVWAWATMRHRPSAKALAAMERRMLVCVDDFKPQALSNTVWAWATMRHQPSADALAALERRMLACVDDFDPQALANTVWAWATMRHQPSAKAMTALERRVLACVDDFNPQALANTVWAWATMRHQPSTDALAALERRMLACVDDFKPQALSNTVWAWATMRHQPSADALAAMERRVLACVDDFDPQALANTVWAWATMRHQPSTDALAALERRMLACVDDFKPQELANTVWAWATMRHQPSADALAAMERRMLACVDDFNPQELANTVWAWATMRHQPSADALIALERRMLACVDDFKPQNLANTLWAVAMLMNNIEGDKITIDQNILDRLLRRLEHAAQLRSLDVIDYRQIFLAHHLLSDRFKPSVALLDQAREAWAQQFASVSSSSRSFLNKEVAACLDRLSIAYDVEALTEDGMHRIDMLVRGRTDDGGERLLAIKCDGRARFMRASDGTYRIDGSTYARNCDLRKLGLGVLSVARHEWIRLKKDERDAYLSRELQERGIVVFSR